MYRTIVVGCDGDEQQADALALAQQLRAPQGRLELVHVFLSADARRERAQKVVAGAAASVPPEVPCGSHTPAAASAAAGLDEVAESVQADLIVLGRSERSFVAELAGLKTIQRLLHGAPCALAVAANGHRGFSASPLVGVAYDGTPESELALSTAYEIAAGEQARVLICQVLEPMLAVAELAGVVEHDEDVERSMRAGLEAAGGRAPAGVSVEPRLLHGSPPFELLLEAMGHADLIVAGSRGHGTLHRALAGSTSAVMLKDARTSVLVTPRGEPQKS